MVSQMMEEPIVPLMAQHAAADQARVPQPMAQPTPPQEGVINAV
jgi:hypothetical protein